MELGIILVLVLILFGAGRLPEVFSQFGKAVKGFKDAQRDDPLDVTRDSQKSLTEGVEDVEEARARDKAKRAS